MSFNLFSKKVHSFKKTTQWRLLLFLIILILITPPCDPYVYKEKTVIMFWLVSPNFYGVIDDYYHKKYHYTNM